MIQVFLFGAYKYPRELTWVVGVFLLPVHAGHGLHRPGPALRPGRVLGARHRRVDRGRVAGRRPAAGALLLGGPIIAGATLSRFFALHVFVIPGAADRASSACTCCWCSSSASTSGRCPAASVDRETYLREYHELRRSRTACRSCPYAVWKDIVVIGRRPARRLLAAPRSSARSARAASPIPTIIQTAPKPDFFFLCAVRAASRSCRPAPRRRSCCWPAARRSSRCCVVAVRRRRRREELAAAAGRRAERRADRAVARDADSPRPLHAVEPGDGRMERAADAERYVIGRTPLELQGALVFQASSAATATAGRRRRASAGRRSTASRFG